MDELMNLTPKQFVSQWEVHKSLSRASKNAKSNGPQDGFIDQIGGW